MTTLPSFRERVRRGNNGPIAWWLARYQVSIRHRGKDRLWRGLYRFFCRPSVKVVYAEHGLLSLEIDDLVQKEILTTGFYEPEVWDTLASFVNTNEVIWDVGAHVGSFAIRASLDARVSSIACFEPNPTTAQLLRRNIALNPHCRVTHVPMALGASVGTRQLYGADPQNIGLASLLPRDSEQGVAVNCSTVDDLVISGQCPTPTLMKIDVEGLEFEVLKGAKRTLEKGCIKAIVFEFEVKGIEIANPDLLHFLSRMGYVTRRIERPDGTITTRENFIAFKP